MPKLGHGKRWEKGIPLKSEEDIGCFQEITQSGMFLCEGIYREGNKRVVSLMIITNEKYIRI
jgi:hypothetical protein